MLVSTSCAQCVKSSLGAVHTRDSNSPSLAARAAIDRQQNIVISGVKEDQDPALWRHKVEDIVEFVRYASVHIVDMFRLGRRSTEKARPILVKLGQTHYTERL